MSIIQQHHHTRYHILSSPRKPSPNPTSPASGHGVISLALRRRPRSQPGHGHLSHLPHPIPLPLPRVFSPAWLLLLPRPVEGPTLRWRPVPAGEAGGVRGGWGWGWGRSGAGGRWEAAGRGGVVGLGGPDFGGHGSIGWICEDGSSFRKVSSFAFFWFLDYNIGLGSGFFSLLINCAK